MKKNIKYIVSVSSMALLFGGCSSSNPFGVGYENSTCESSKSGGLCGAPSSIYKYKAQVKQIQKDYLMSGYKGELFFAISREGKIMVKESRDAKWQPYQGSEYESKIRAGLNSKYKTNLGSSYTSTKSDIPVGKNNDLSISYNQKQKYLQTRTNVGRMIRDNGEYSRVWVAPYVDRKGDLVSAHEIYTVIRDPEWIVGEKTPKKIVDAATPIPSPISVEMLNKTRKADYITASKRSTSTTKSSDEAISSFLGK
jgi:hypothetical protein